MSSKIVIETTDGEIVFEQLSRTFPPSITLRKYDYVDTDQVWPETYPDGEKNPRAGHPIQERKCVGETKHRLGSTAVREILKALQYYS